MTARTRKPPAPAFVTAESAPETPATAPVEPATPLSEPSGALAVPAPAAVAVPDVADDQAATVAVPDEPVPLFAGTYAIYDDGAGGIALVFTDQDGTTHRKRVPAAMLRMGSSLMGSRLSRMFV